VAGVGFVIASTAFFTSSARVVAFLATGFKGFTEAEGLPMPETVFLASAEDEVVAEMVFLEASVFGFSLVSSSSDSESEDGAGVGRELGDRAGTGIGGLALV